MTDSVVNHKNKTVVLSLVSLVMVLILAGCTTTTDQTTATTDDTSPAAESSVPAQLNVPDQNEPAAPLPVTSNADNSTPILGQTEAKPNTVTADLTNALDDINSTSSKLDSEIQKIETGLNDQQTNLTE
jgi:hypothetical protein